MASENGDITPEKVMFGFMMMATAGRTGMNPLEMAHAASRMQCDCIAALLKDDTGQAREQMVDRLRTLWAVYEEHNPQESPWDIQSS